MEYETILKRMKNTFSSKCGYNPDEASDIGIRMEVLAGEIYNAYSHMEWLKNQTFPQTATDNWLDYHAQLRGITRKEATKATMLLNFYLDGLAEEDIIIPKGTICSTLGEDAVRFITTDDTVISAGGRSIYTSAEALEGGSKFNAKVGTVTVIVTIPLTGLKVTNATVTAYGTDSESDESLRQRILSSMAEIPNGGNSAFYIGAAKSYSGVNSAGVVPRARGNGTVDVYIAGNGTVVSDNVLNSVQNGLQSMRELNVDVMVKKAEMIKYKPYISINVKDGYDFDEVTDNIEAALKVYFKTLGVGESVYLSSMAEVIYHVDGVKHFVFDNNYTADLSVANSAFVALDTVMIKQGSES